MAYVKSFADRGQWRDISLTDDQERDCYQKAIMTHNQDMLNCIDDAREILKTKRIDQIVPALGMITIAVALFDKRAKHNQYFREEKSREVFESKIIKPETLSNKSDWVAKREDIKSNLPDIEPKSSPLEDIIQKRV